MDVRIVLKELESKAKPHMAALLARHGIEGMAWFVSYADFGIMTRQYAGDHALALELWESRIHDARVLATMIADPEQMTAKQITKWIGESNYYALSAAVSLTAGRLPAAHAHARKWIESKSQWTAAAGWNVIAQLAMKGRLEGKDAAAYVERIRDELVGERNWVKYAMNGALIAIGGSMPALRDPALAAARELGAVDVDHGETECKTPDALKMIPKMAERALAKAAKSPKPLRKSAR